ncbi:hypothetical protein SAMN05444143_104206 [Flavobacterium succinicans]|jgi:hypothetical protein|uniref:Uncharacterized protein n=2 Tax=Flavobacterium succinicans TaxID=29536 RepID=A0A1I4VAT6_9FLAO|nr:hypothetical protein SAMN05444143_104206 [Flavobacterium succinicans]
MAFFLPMKNALLFICLLAIYTMQAQEKISSKKKKFYVPTIEYAAFPILDNVLTQTTFYQMDKELIQEELILKKKYFNIDGYIKDAANGKLKIFVTIALPKYNSTKVDSIFDKKKGQWNFRVASNYAVQIKVEAKCADKVLLAENFNSIESYFIGVDYQKSELKLAVETHDKAVQVAFLKEDYNVEVLGIDNAIYQSMEKIQKYLNYKLRYSKGESKEKFEFVTTKGHPEYNQLLGFENEITAQMQKVTLEKGLDIKTLQPHLNYLESLLIKYPVAPDNEYLRFIVLNNLAQTYFLLENKEKALLFANLLIENDKLDSRGSTIVKRVNNAFFVDKISRRHTTRFTELKKLGLKIAEEKEELRLAFFEKIQQQDADWELEKSNREANLLKSKNLRLNMLDSIAYQSKPDLLAKVVASLGGSQALKSIEKAHLFSKLFVEGNRITLTEEKWATASNYLLKKKMPENYYEIVNGAEAWTHDDRETGVNAKWAKETSYGHNLLAKNLDLIHFLSDFRLDLWNDLELLEDQIVEGTPCYHLNYFEKTLNSANRSIPKTDYHVFIDKATYRILASEKTEFDNGNKSFFERKLFLDYRPIAALNAGALPHKVTYEIEDFNGDTFYQELREKIDINPVFGNRIFIKEVYFGGFK